MKELKEKMNNLNNTVKEGIRLLYEGGIKSYNNKNYMTGLQLLRNALKLCFIYEEYQYYKDIDKLIKQCELEIIKKDKESI